MADGCRRCKTIDRKDKDLAAICDEFDEKMSFNFKLLVFLIPPESSFGLEVAVQLASSCEGYEAHRVVYCKDKASHMHVRYATEEHAKTAIDNFQKYAGLLAGKVYDLLKTLYIVERSCKLLPSWTLAIVDIDGVVKHTNPLSKEVLDSLLKKFGKPHIFSYRTGYKKVEHVQVLFSSMAEALGASIAHGYWFKGCELESTRFRYRVRLVVSEKESVVLKESCTFDPESGAYDLDYFIGTDSEDSMTEPKLQNLNSSNSTFNEMPMRGGENEPGRFYGREFSSSNWRSNKPTRGRGSKSRRNYGPEHIPSCLQTFSGSGHMVHKDFRYGSEMDFLHMPN